MSRREKERLQDILAAIQAIDPGVLAKEPLPWADIAKNRDYLAHRYFDTSHAIVRGTVENDLPRLEAAVNRPSTD